MSNNMEELLTRFNKKKEKPEEQNEEKTQEKRQGIIKKNLEFSENTITASKYIEIPEFLSNKKTSKEKEDYLLLSPRERRDMDLPTVNDEFISYTGNNPKKVYATRRNGEKVYAEDVSDKIYRTEDIKNGKVSRDEVFVNIKGKDYFRKPEDAHYDMLNEINKYSTNKDNDTEYGGIIYSISDGKNIGYASTPAYIGAGVKSVDLGIAETYYFNFEKQKLERQGLKVEKVGGYHTHMAPQGLFFDDKENPVETGVSSNGKNLAHFFSTSGTWSNDRTSKGAPSDTNYAHYNKSLSVVTPGILEDKNKNEEQKYKEEPTMWLYISDGLEKKTGTLKYLGIASSYKNEPNKNFNIMGGTRIKPNVIYNESHDKEFTKILNNHIEGLLRAVDGKQNNQKNREQDMIR